MELDDFVSSVLIKILSGIRSAQDDSVAGAFIVPSFIGGHYYAEHPRVSIKADLSSTIVDFDIAVTVEDKKSSSKDGGIKIYGLGVSANGASVMKDASVSRIQFAVPILLPVSQKNWDEELKRKK